MVASIGLLLFWDRFSVSKPLSQIQRRTLLFLQQASYTPSFGGLGLSLERHTWLDGATSQEVARGRLVVGLEIVLEGDFVREPVPATAVFEAGEWVTTVTVPTIDDEQLEPTGSVSLRVMSQGFGLLSNAEPVEADVYDNDMPVSIADAEEFENDGELTFTISLQEPAVIPVKVEVVTVDGTATSHGVVTATDFGKDFVAKSETLTFDIGEQDKQFAVTIVDDRWDEASEVFTVELSNPSYARLQGRLRHRQDTG